MTGYKLEFKNNQQLSMGVELELQLIDLQTYNLTMEAMDLLSRLSKINLSGAAIKPEITQSMIEINSSVHHNYQSLHQELCELRRLLAEHAVMANVGICGGGAHPFQKWSEQWIYPTERFLNLSEKYGYLAQQFTVFAQHIHIACPNGDDAIYLCHALAPYIPHFIALSAASPFYQGIDTRFDGSRLSVLGAFPLSGTPPWLTTWSEFSNYFNQMQRLNIVKSMKDFYWDIRPKPEYGTVEIRVADTPLTITKAAELAAYAQMLVYYLLKHRPKLSEKIYLTYLTNRFRATRYGFEAILIDPVLELHTPLTVHMLETCEKLVDCAERLQSTEALEQIKKAVILRENGARWQKQRYAELNSLKALVKEQTALWLEVHEREVVT